ncbi:SipW-dependent-type signal peptide-containing protein [Clostridium sp. D2Q-11]|uniref:SipW-dependent-type signal peptide-containing protein n=1 Tax=Anaeromonas frigoriresistens TaxID=2683708 RepID=A0A942USX7_9FIRM|nr:SipW-dependent-type signal peptide-containing protein [Anaeromonas frigoriresistens]MBS4538548.1 SipW-dependent-type signal peptide-containing protein [Anaeromonas frigoriresistens]
MKKTKFLALALAVALMTMGAGYAYWTDTIEIKNTVNTGHLDVHFVDEHSFNFDEAPYVTGKVLYSQRNLANTKEENNWDVANVEFNNMYPGAYAKVTLKMANNSTIPVGMDAITDTRSADFNNVFVHPGASLRFFKADGTPIREFSADTTEYANPWIPDQLKDAEIPVGGYATLTFMFRANENAREDATYTFNPTAVFKQFNAQ